MEDDIRGKDHFFFRDVNRDSARGMARHGEQFEGQAAVVDAPWLSSERYFRHPHALALHQLFAPRAVLDPLQNGVGVDSLATRKSRVARELTRVPGKKSAPWKWSGCSSVTMR